MEKQKKQFLGMLLVLAVLAAAYGGIHVYNQKQEEKEASEEEAEKLLKGYLALGYRYFEENAGSSEDVERLVVLLDERYFYDETGYLRSGNRSVRRLFHRLNQAKEELAFVVKKNEEVYSVILGLLQAM